MPTVYLIRHAEPVSPWDWDGDDASRPLSARGLKQAQWMGEHLRGLRVADFRTAPHFRCRQTADEIGKVLDLQPEVDDRLHIARTFRVKDLQGLSVWVAHSNNIPDAVMRLGVPCNACGHASAWVINLDEQGRVEGYEYIEPEV
ncbi:MAG: histidine phosphatase family protein [Planctomycetes bacterium]|nr:histidine phosphatase family protein [Planctomycetota bacterium]MCB9934959.1 histidine phosphatase family protein [Planctomycetota bacterium]